MLKQNQLVKVGIGTSDPDAKLSVTSAGIASEDILYLKSGADNADEYLGIAFETGGGGSGPHGAIRIYNGPSGSDSYMSLLTTTDGGTLTQGLTQNHLGNIGIGTTTPARNLHISSADNQLARFESTDAYGGIEICDNTSGVAKPLISALGDAFIFYNGGSSHTEAMRIDSSQDTTFAGNATFAGTVQINGEQLQLTSSNDEKPTIVLYDTTNSANGSVLRFKKDKGAAGADDDEIGRIFFTSDDAAQTQTDFALIRGAVETAANGTEGGRIELKVASHDGEMQTGIAIFDGDAEDEIDVTIGSGVSSVTTVAGKYYS